MGGCPEINRDLTGHRPDGHRDAWVDGIEITRRLKLNPRSVLILTVYEEPAAGLTGRGSRISHQQAAEEERSPPSGQSRRYVYPPCRTASAEGPRSAKTKEV
jgi:hypothetical protein